MIVLRLMLANLILMKVKCSYLKAATGLETQSSVPHIEAFHSLSAIPWLFQAYSTCIELWQTEWLCLLCVNANGGLDQRKKISFSSNPELLFDQ